MSRWSDETPGVLRSEEEGKRARVRETQGEKDLMAISGFEDGRGH